MSTFDRIFNEGYDVSGEAEALRRGDSTAWLKRTQACGPSSKASAAAGRWAYEPVEVKNGGLTKWVPPSKMMDLSIGAQKVHQESIDETTDRIDAILSAVSGDLEEADSAPREYSVLKHLLQVFKKSGNDAAVKTLKKEIHNLDRMTR